MKEWFFNYLKSITPISHPMDDLDGLLSSIQDDIDRVKKHIHDALHEELIN